MGSSVHWEPSVPKSRSIWGHPSIGSHQFPYLGPYGVIRTLGSISSRYRGYMRTWSHWDPVFWDRLGSSVHWEPSVPKSRSIWGHPSIGSHQFPYLGPYGVIRTLGSISSRYRGYMRTWSHWDPVFWDRLGSSVHWEPSVPVDMGSSTHWDPSVPISRSIWGHPSNGIHQFPLPWLYEAMEPLASRFLGPFGVIRPLGPSVPVYMGSSIHWDPSVPVDMGSSTYWDPLVPISGSIWGHPSIGIHQFPYLGPYGVIRPLGAISSQIQVHMGSSIHWDPSVPKSRSIWGHLSIGIRPFPYLGPYGVIHSLGSISSRYRGYMRTLSHWDRVFWDHLGSSVHWDPSVPVDMGSSTHWDPSVPISRSIWGHPSIGSHQFPNPGPYGVTRPLGAISSQIQVHMGSSVHWEPSVPKSRSIWGHPSNGIHRFPLPWLYEDMEPLGSCFLGPFGVICPLGAIGSR
ncbi:uncharacterized protein LOC112533551 isoform X2 [Gallus gallus]|uniref:uncharacterized protein LOC112533551 isoform X2 n=1 Tax=Gallus gallus TaxID=9031 RepID=UPI001AE32245|nr:uncharacterized protein LOC112533551 isoform X2 [Gallus gallus]